MTANDTATMEELRRESRIGQAGYEVERDIPQIDLSDFTNRRAEITEQLWDAAVNVGFFQLYNHGIPVAHIDEAFACSQRFFALPHETKEQYPLKPGQNAGWECMSQVRPSTGKADRKESYQVTLPRMEGLWPNGDEVRDFREVILRFERQSWQLGMRILSCFADKLGFTTDFFTDAHDPLSPEYQSTLRLLHYFAVDGPEEGEEPVWRAGAHTDFDCLTLLYQRPGEDGLQVCPGMERDSGAWTSIEPTEGAITCNIGDMLMRWSDDALQSTLHRVRGPAPGEQQDARYSIAFFCQANRDVSIEGPQGIYEPIRADEYLRQRIKANF